MINQDLLIDLLFTLVVGLHIAVVIHKGFDKVTWPTKRKEETERDQQASNASTKNSACVSECSCGDEAK